MILVTGGAGFIGSNLVAELCRTGHSVVVCDRLEVGDKWRNLAKHDVCDVISPAQLGGWLAYGQQLEMVFHLGAISATTETDGDLLFDVNVRFSTLLLDWCTETATPFVYASSAATYGAGREGFDDSGGMEALERLRPLNAYGWSKHFFDRRVARRVSDGLRMPRQWVGLKFFNVFGPNEYHKGAMQSVVAQKYPLVAAGQPVTLFKSHRPEYPHGGQMRDFVFVDDCVDVMLWLLTHPEVSGLFNLGSGRARSFGDVARAIAAAAGQPSQIEFIAMPEAIRPNYQYFTEARMEKLRSIGYSSPFTSLEDGVKQYVERFLSQPDHYR
jgi:ADP-L-glycero-D-manno-heptose 6-epimerase